ncbi:MAG: PorV/PorQ family protein [candidate division Zixibacteria bacterium]|nr:PorV/PorQ family protein [candidate division Zixibacteria bacterium]
MRITVTGVLAAILLSSPGLLAGDAGHETPFVSLGVGARSLGMGGGFTSMAADATSIHYNPAGLASLEYQEVSFMHSILFEGSTYDFASWVYPIDENHGLGAGVMRIGTGDIIRRVDFADRGRFDYAYTQMVLAYGRNLGEPLAAGLALKVLNQSLENRSDFGISMDLGLSVRLRHGLYWGASVREVLQHELTLLIEAEKIPMALVSGLSWRDLNLSSQVRLSLAFDVEKHADREFKVRAGAEAVLGDVLSLRGGYDRDNLAFGVGFKSRRMNIDYAYKIVDFIDGMHHISISFLLGASTTERIRLRELAKLPPELTEEEKRFNALMATADRYFRRFQLDSARAYFEQALQMQPNNEEIIGTLAAIEESRRVQEEQEEALRVARESLSQTQHTFITQAEQMLDQKMYRAALDFLGLIFEIDPGNTSANQLRDQIVAARSAELAESLEHAQQAASAGRWSEAVEAYNRVLELDPENATAQQAKLQMLAALDLPQKIRLAVELFDRGELAEAATRFRAILDVNPNESMAQDYLRRILEQQAVRPPATLEDLQNDRESWELYLEGLRFMRNKEYQKAIEAWEKVLQAYPNNANTLDNIKQARLRLGTQGNGN